MEFTLTVRLSENEAQDLKAICELSGKTRSEVVREAWLDDRACVRTPGPVKDE